MAFSLLTLHFISPSRFHSLALCSLMARSATSTVLSEGGGGFHRCKVVHAALFFLLEKENVLEDKTFLARTSNVASADNSKILPPTQFHFYKRLYFTGTLKSTDHLLLKKNHQVHKCVRERVILNSLDFFQIKIDQLKLLS